MDGNNLTRTVMNYSLQVQNLKCGGCAKTISEKLATIEEISAIAVEVQTSTVSFNATNEAAFQKVENKLIEIGYPPEGTKNSMLTKAKSFVSCATGKLSS